MSKHPDESAPLHPLHSPQFVADCVLNTARLPGMRRTGRRALALEYIARAMRSPRHTVLLLDHYDNTAAHAHMKEVVQAMLSSLDFRHFTLARAPSRAGAWALTFGD